MGHRVRIEFSTRQDLNWVKILISKSRFESRCWYQVFGSSHDVDIEYWLEFAIRLAKTWSDLVVEFVDINCVLNLMIFFLKCCIGIESISSRITMLISSIWVESRCWISSIWVELESWYRFLTRRLIYF